MNKNVLRNSNYRFKNTKFVLNLIILFFQGLIIYTLLGIWSMYVDKIIYGENKYLDNIIIAIIIGLGTLVTHQTLGGILIFNSYIIIESVYKQIVKNNVRLNIIHVILTVISLGFVFCLYFVHFYMEIYFQRPDKIPELFSNESLKYFLAGFLKPMIIITMLVVAFIIDLIDKNNKIFHIEEQIKKSSNVNSNV